MGKGIRAPAKDAILSNVTTGVGRGWGFGIHETLDQIGAIIGPVIFSAAYLLRGDYRAGFALLLIPRTDDHRAHRHSQQGAGTVRI